MPQAARALPQSELGGAITCKLRHQLDNGAPPVGGERSFKKPGGLIAAQPLLEKIIPGQGHAFPAFPQLSHTSIMTPAGPLRKPGTDMNFRRSLPEIRCLSSVSLAGYAPFSPCARKRLSTRYRAQLGIGPQALREPDAISRCQATKRIRPIRIRALVRPTQMPVTPQP